MTTTLNRNIYVQPATVPGERIAYWCARCKHFTKGPHCPTCGSVATPAGKWLT